MGGLSKYTVISWKLSNPAFLIQNCWFNGPKKSFLHLVSKRRITDATQVSRHFSSHRFSTNLEYFSANKQLVKPTHKKSFKVLSEDGVERPLALLMCWLLSKDNHIRKYVHFYTDLGVDVLTVRISLFELFRPKTGSQAVASQMLEFLHHNTGHRPVVVHAFSAGGYLFNEGVALIEKDLERHGALVDRFVGQIYDSGVDVYAIPEGVSKISTNPHIQKSIQRSLEWFLKARYESATKHYENSSRVFNENFIRKPGLFLFSDVDPVSTPEMNQFVVNNWTAKGIPVWAHCFSKSSHVTHFHHHHDEYKEVVTRFLKEVDFLTS